MSFYNSKILTISNIYRLVFDQKDQVAIDGYTESIKQKVNLIESVELCQRVPYYNTIEFSCLKTSGPECNVKKMKLQQMIDLDKRLENAIIDCYKITS